MERVRSELSRKNQYYISKEQYYELKHFCLQYPEWKKQLNELRAGSTVKSPKFTGVSFHYDISDRTADEAIKAESLERKIKLVVDCCKKTDESIANYLLSNVTEGTSYDILRYVHGMPCGKDLFYDRYHKFFWILAQER